MKFLVMIYNDDTLLDALPQGEFDTMMKGCFAKAEGNCCSQPHPSSNPALMFSVAPSSRSHTCPSSQIPSVTEIQVSPSRSRLTRTRSGSHRSRSA